MVVEVISKVETIPANTTGKIYELIVRKGERITILETAYTISAAGKIEGFLMEKLIDDIQYGLYNDANHRVLREIVMEEGQIYKFVGKDESGAANKMGIFLVIKREVV